MYKRRSSAYKDNVETFPALAMPSIPPSGCSLMARGLVAMANKRGGGVALFGSTMKENRDIWSPFVWTGATALPKRSILG